MHLVRGSGPMQVRTEKETWGMAAVEYLPIGKYRYQEWTGNRDGEVV